MMAARSLFVVAPSWAGSWHRFRTINHVLPFAKERGYRVTFLWALSGGVSYCRFEDLFAPISGVTVLNVPQQQVDNLEATHKRSRKLRIQGETITVHSRGNPPAENMLAFDLAAAEALEEMVPADSRSTHKVVAKPAAQIRNDAISFVKKQDLPRRIGIRVRVTECSADGRKPRRLQADLDQTVKSIIQIPWYTRVFIVTDSEYVQQMLASHFTDAAFVSKRFGDSGPGGRYVHRHDPLDMRHFVTEITCLADCWKIVNIGGVINQDAICQKMIAAPYERSLGGMRRLLAAGVVRR